MITMLLFAPDRFKTWWELYGTGCPKRSYVAAVTRPATGDKVWWGCGQYSESKDIQDGNTGGWEMYVSKYNKDGSWIQTKAVSVEQRVKYVCLYSTSMVSRLLSPCMFQRNGGCRFGYTANQPAGIISQAYYKCTALNTPCKTASCPYKQRIY